ncbi:site-specific integrase [Siphonobacter sp. SORGH_AS_1065]|uniref:site-specific integrase n=1 Tax=Siphonobacter sp. SORGH_AS_1065 TaxID=3041795 RepID=UPI0027844FEA|nr:site-specific integrase [Siphonobacter sp. SORGH_AS_1065]MDQ1086185.1 integrase/recombinase XerD [Siphonobacter sp. SORGH_AS_1065]
MASSLKVVLRKKANQDGTFPLALRITVNRKSSFIYLGQHVKESDWDEKAQKVKKSHPNSTRLNNLILQKKAEVNGKMLEMETQHKSVSSVSVRSHVKSTSGTSFFEQAEQHLENLRKHGKYNRVSAEKPRIKHFREFLKSQDIVFTDITIPLLNRFKAYLKSTRRITERTIVNHLILIRTIYNQAIAAGLVEPKHYPFGKNKVTIRLPDSLKVGLTLEELKLLENLDLSSAPRYWTHARNVWLVSFYFAGMRVSDVLRLKHMDFHNARLYYTMGKNLKAGSLKVPEKALRILETYPKESNHDLVFPELQKLESLEDPYLVQRAIATAVKRLDRNLQLLAKTAGIQKDLTMHIARHTFGNLSGEKIPIQLLQKLYRHTSITTTIGYQGNFINKDADDALDAVLDL